jgi:hypothetical protein
MTTHRCRRLTLPGLRTASPFALAAALGLILAGPLSAQHGVPIKGQTQKLRPALGTPCCDITAIDGVANTATAIDKATGQSFTFSVADRSLLQNLRIGQSISADLPAGRVSVNQSNPCCDIVSGGAAAPAAAQLQPAPADPCCNITAIGAGAGVATAKDKTTGRTITFTVPDQSTLQGLQVGQAVYADRTAGKVSVNPATPCCNILSGGIAARTSTQLQPAGVDPCCEIVANPAAGTHLGRVVVAFPSAGMDVGTHIELFKAGATTPLATKNSSLEVDVPPGTYMVSIGGAKVDNVTVRAGHDTKVRVGVLRVKAAGDSHMELLGSDAKTTLATWNGAQAIGLPPGTYQLQVGGRTQAVTIHAGTITDF